MQIRTVVFKNGVLVENQTTYDLSDDVFTSGEYIEKHDTREEKIAKRLMGIPYKPRVFVNLVEVEEGKDYKETESTNVIFGKKYTLENQWNTIKSPVVIVSSSSQKSQTTQ